MSTELEWARRVAIGCFGSEPRIEPISRLNHLVFRLHYPLDTKVLKLAKGSDSSTIRKELTLIDLVARQGIPAPSIEVADPDGSQLGRAFLVMRSAGEGTLADRLGDGGTGSLPLFTEMGSVLARVHEIQFAGSGDIRPEGIVPFDAVAIRGDLDRLSAWAAARGFLRPAEAERFQDLPTPSLEGARLCHRDFHAVQCVERAGRIAAVVDWESAWSSNPLIDLAITHAYLDFYCPAPLKAGFFEGYAATRPIPPDYDSASLPVRMAHALGMMRAWDAQGHLGNIPRTVEIYRAYLGAI
jgi:Ser/Thr protein kinase RdoA (MazF antagonist)